MPLYEYVCESCGVHFEKLLRFTEQAPEAECPVCGSGDTHKLISLFAASGASAVGASTAGCGSSSSGFR